MSKPTIAVLGASGNTGKPTVNNLLQSKDKFNIRVIGRSKDKLAEFEKNGAEIAIASEFSEEALVPALKGVDRLWFTAPNPALTDKAFDRTNLAKKAVDAAKKAGVSFIVLAGVRGSEYESIVFTKEFRDLERYIEASGIPYAGLRMGAFVENVIGSKQALDNGVYPQPIATDKPFSLVSVEDVGAFSAAVLTAGPEKYKNQYFDLTGGDSLSTQQQAAALSKALGKEIKAIQAPDEEFKKALTGVFAPYQVDGFIELYGVFAQGLAAATDNDTFKKVVGRDYISYQQRVTDLHNWGVL